MNRLGTGKVEFVPMPEDLRGQYQNYTCAELSGLREAGYRGAFTPLADGIAPDLCLSQCFAVPESHFAEVNHVVRFASRSLCISTYEKGQAFLREVAAQGCDIRLLTVDKLRDADWPKDILTEFLTMPARPDAGADGEHGVVSGAHAAHRPHCAARRIRPGNRGAAARAHAPARPGADAHTCFFRDKLAMRTGARAAGIAVPEFCRGVQLYDDLRAFMHAVPGPWLLKPRTNASAIGIKPIGTADELWPILDALGDAQSHYLLERFVAGDVFHVEGVTSGGKLLFAQPFQYGKPPIETMHQGGIFTTRTLAPQSAEARGPARDSQPSDSGARLAVRA